MSSKNTLQEYCQRHGYYLPIYNTKGNMPFVSTVDVCGIKVEGYSRNSKKEAEKSAAEIAVNTILNKSSTLVIVDMKHSSDVQLRDTSAVIYVGCQDQAKVPVGAVYSSTVHKGTAGILVKMTALTTRLVDQYSRVIVVSDCLAQIIADTVNEMNHGPDKVIATTSVNISDLIK